MANDTKYFVEQLQFFEKRDLALGFNKLDKCKSEILSNDLWHMNAGCWHVFKDGSHARGISTRVGWLGGLP